MPTKRAVAIVEDRVAGQFLRAILDTLAPDLSDSVAISFAVSGESGVVRVVNELAEGTDNAGLVVVGVLDGDQRQPLSDTSDQYGYLIGDEAPEQVMRYAVGVWWRRDRASSWSPRLNGGGDALRMSLERFDGLDHHDWIFALAEQFGGIDHIIGCFVELLLEEGNAQEQGEELISWLRKKCEC